MVQAEDVEGSAEAEMVQEEEDSAKVVKEDVAEVSVVDQEEVVMEVPVVEAAVDQEEVVKEVPVVGAVVDQEEVEEADAELISI